VCACRGVHLSYARFPLFNAWRDLACVVVQCIPASPVSTLAYLKHSGSTSIILPTPRMRVASFWLRVLLVWFNRLLMPALVI